MKQKAQDELILLDIFAVDSPVPAIAQEIWAGLFSWFLHDGCQSRRIGEILCLSLKINDL